MRHSAFDVLEIEQTTNKKKIKKAYAELVKRYHPEEFPEEWKIVHDAYEAAIKWADSHAGMDAGLKKDKKEGEDRQEKSKIESKEEGRGDRQEGREKYREERQKEQEKSNGEINSQKPERESENEEELINIFENIEELASENSQITLAMNKAKLQSALNELERLGNNGMLRLEKWKALFENEDYEWAVWQEAFVDKWGDVLSGKRINHELYLFMKEKLKKIKEITGSIDSNLNTITYTQMKIESAYRRYTERQRKILIATLSISILFWVMKGYRTSSGGLNEHKEQTLEELTQEIEINTENLERIWMDTKDRGTEMSLTLLISSDDEKKQKWFDRSQYVGEGIYLLDVRDIPTGYEENYGGMEPREYSIAEVPEPDWLRNVPDREFLTEDSYTFYISSPEECWGALLWCDPQVLGFDGDYRIYSKTDYGYMEMIPAEEAGKGMEEVSGNMQRYEVMGYQVFSVQLPVEVVIVASK